MKAPEGFTAPTPEVATEWQYLVTERLGIMCENRIPSSQQEARAKFEADREIERLFGGTYCDGWMEIEKP